jgi:hypothetical protein
VKRDEPEPKRAAPSTLGGSSIELPSPVSREETLLSARRNDLGHKGVIAVAIASAVALVAGVVLMQQRSSSSAAAQVSAHPPVLAQTAPRAIEPESLRVEPRDSGVAAIPSVEPALSAPVSPTVTATSQTAQSSLRPGRRPTPVAPSATNHSNQPAATTGSAPTTTGDHPANAAANPRQTNPSTQTPTEGPRQVGGGFVL